MLPPLFLDDLRRHALEPGLVAALITLEDPLQQISAGHGPLPGAAATGSSRSGMSEMGARVTGSAGRQRGRSARVTASLARTATGTSPSRLSWGRLVFRESR